MKSHRTKPARACGECTACCTVVGVGDMSPPKPPGVACGHLCGSGCGIYADRPTSCAEYECGWLATQRQPGAALPGRFRPDRCHVVFHETTTPGTIVGEINPARPGGWTVGAAHEFIMNLLAAGVKVIIRHPVDMSAVFLQPDGSALPMRLVEDGDSVASYALDVARPAP